MTLEKKSKVSLTDEQLAIREANRQKAAVYKERRIALGLSQEQLAQKAGIDRSTVSHMESGQYSPLWETRQKIRYALGMPEERFYSIKERNAIFLELQEQGLITWIVRKNTSFLHAIGASSYLDDLSQELSVHVIRSIDHFRPDGGASLVTFVTRSTTLFVKYWARKFYMHGLTGSVSYPLPRVSVLSLEALKESDFDIAG